MKFTVWKYLENAIKDLTDEDDEWHNLRLKDYDWDKLPCKKYCPPKGHMVRSQHSVDFFHKKCFFNTSLSICVSFVSYAFGIQTNNVCMFMPPEEGQTKVMQVLLKKGMNKIWYSSLWRGDKHPPLEELERVLHNILNFYWT